MTWTLTAAGVSVTLPIVNDLGDVADSDLDLFKQDGVQPILTVTAPGERTLTLAGSFYVQNQTNLYLETTYLLRLRSLKSLEVYLTSTDAQFDGYWVLKSYNLHKVAEGTVARWFFNLVLTQGSDTNVL